MVCVCNMVGGGNYDDVYAVDDAEDDDVYAVDDEVTLVHGQAAWASLCNRNSDHHVGDSPKKSVWII